MEVLNMPGNELSMFIDQEIHPTLTLVRHPYNKIVKIIPEIFLDAHNTQTDIHLRDNNGR